MQMLTKELKEKIPPLYSQEEKGESAEVVLKYFCPWNQWRWYITEGSAQIQRSPDADIEYIPLADLEKTLQNGISLVDIIFFGWVYGDYPELGYISYNEITSVRGPWGLTIERDLHWHEKPLETVKADIERGVF